MSDDPNSPVALVNVATEIEANIIIGQLEQRGLDAKAIGGFISSFRAEAPGDVSVVVKQCDLKKAQAALDEIQDDQTEIDWSQVDVGPSE